MNTALLCKFFEYYLEKMFSLLYRAFDNIQHRSNFINCFNIAIANHARTNRLYCLFDPLFVKN